MRSLRSRAYVASREFERRLSIERSRGKQAERASQESREVTEFGGLRVETARLPVPDVTVAHSEYRGQVRVVYVAWPRGDQFVKIGVTGSIPERFKELQNGNPRPLVLVAAFLEGEGGWNEPYLHRRFAPYRAEGEWFRLEGELADWIGPTIALTEPGFRPPHQTRPRKPARRT